MKLYYEDPYIKDFTAALVEQKQDNDNRWYAVLDKTAFYPEGGGQPYDTGTLNGFRVVEVQEVEGEIRHYLLEPLDTVYKEVQGCIDWERRFDHMQQHAGQHLLSAAFEELLSFKTLSFHLGKDVSTIDLDTAVLSEAGALKVEKLVNQIILENRPIEAKWVSADELSEYPLRKALAVSEDIRLVIIPEFDYNGCGGTHPASTGSVSSLKILDWEKQGKKTRVAFVCGGRVLKNLHDKQKVTKELSALLNAPQEKFGEAVAGLLEQNKAQAKEMKEVQQKLLLLEATELAAQKELLQDLVVIKKIFSNRSMSELQTMARTLVSMNALVNVVFISETENKLQFVLASGSESSVNMKEIASEVLPAINGKGGGNPSFAQGGGEGNAEELMEKIVFLIN